MAQALIRTESASKIFENSPLTFLEEFKFKLKGETMKRFIIENLKDFDFNSDSDFE